MEADLVNQEEDVIGVPVGVQQLFDERKRQKVNRTVRAEEAKLYRMAVICGAIIIMFAYFMMPVSRVSTVRIKGNSFLNQEYIRDLCEVSEDSIYYFCVPAIIERRLESDPLIKEADVKLARDNTIAVTVTEEDLVGYRYDDQPVLLLTSGETAELKSEYLDVISRIPLVIGFNTDEQTAKLCRAFSEVDQKIIRDISEISQYSLSYDPQAVRVLMRSGGYFMGNFYNMSVLNRYWDIYNRQNDRSQCIFADDSLTSAYSKVCPWNEPQVNREYWTDENGDFITNVYGDKVEKHYYLDAEGNFALDKQGRKIPVPISLQGYEVPDEDFLSNYEKGFYDTGKLVIPDDYDPDQESAEQTVQPDEQPAEENAAEQTEEPADEPAEEGGEEGN